MQLAFCPLSCVHGLDCIDSAGFRHVCKEVHDSRTELLTCFLLLHNSSFLLLCCVVMLPKPQLSPLLRKVATPYPCAFTAPARVNWRNEASMLYHALPD